MSSVIVEQRELQRQPVHWPVVVRQTVAGHTEICRGRTVDLSPKGASVICDRNGLALGPALARISVPPASVRLQFEHFEIEARIIYTLYGATDQSFRSGLAFVRFISGNPEALRRAIETHICPL